jgi:hypothetical protein
MFRTGIDGRIGGLASTNDSCFTYFDGVVQGMIVTHTEQCISGKRVSGKVYHAAWGINQKDTCPAYDNHQISTVSKMLLAA